MSTLSLIQAVSEATEGDSMARAKELLDLIKSPTAIATGVLAAYAGNRVSKNREATVDKPMTRWAFIAGALAVVLASAVVIVMTPLALRTLTNDGDVESRLLVYWMTYLVAIGTTAYCASTARRCVKQLGGWAKLWPEKRAE